MVIVFLKVVRVGGVRVGFEDGVGGALLHTGCCHILRIASSGRGGLRRFPECKCRAPQRCEVGDVHTVAPIFASRHVSSNLPASSARASNDSYWNTCADVGTE